MAKHADHLPLYRQEAIFGRTGLRIPRSTLAAWVGQCGVRLQSVVDTLKEQLLRCAVVHADETPVAMLAVASCRISAAATGPSSAGTTTNNHGGQPPMLTPDEAAMRAAILSRVPGDGTTIGNVALSKAVAE